MHIRMITFVGVVLSICKDWTATGLTDGGCGNIPTTYNSPTSLVPRSDTQDSNLDIYHRGLSCRDDSRCKAITKTTIGSVEAVCSATPGLIQTARMYIVIRESHIQGTVLVIWINFNPSMDK